MDRKTYDIVGVPITPCKIDEINHQIVEAANKDYTQPLIVFKPYVEFLAKAAKDQKIKTLLNQADINVADATSIQWAGAYLYGSPHIHPNLISTFWSLAVRLQSNPWRSQIFPEKMGGLDMTIPLLELAQKNNLRIGVLGSSNSVDEVKQHLLDRFPHLQLIKAWSGYYEKHTESELVKDIARHKLDILFVAMGFPKQEQFIVTYRNQLKCKILIGEGGSFDYNQLGGSLNRAPKWIRKIGFEWLWRLLRQPSRLKRQMAIPRFIFAVLKQKKQAN